MLSHTQDEFESFKPLEDDAEVIQAEARKPMFSQDFTPIVQSDVDPMLKGRIEAVLFITGRPLHIPEIAATLQVDSLAVEEALMELISDYAYRDGSSLEIEDSDGYILQVRHDYSDVVNRMMPMDISQGAIRTLSAIAIKAPVLQSDLIELRGATAYEHIHELLAKKLISKKRQGRSYMLNVTREFHEYFNLAGDKKDLQSLVRQQPARPQNALMDGDEEPVFEDTEDPIAESA